MKETDTPRTDAEVKRITEGRFHQTPMINPAVTADFARTLERENERLKRAIDVATNIGIYPQSITGGTTDQNYEKRTERMEGWNDCAKEVTQQICAVLGDVDFETSAEKTLSHIWEELGERGQHSIYEIIPDVKADRAENAALREVAKAAEADDATGSGFFMVRHALASLKEKGIQL